MRVNPDKSNRERGSAGVKLIVVLTVIILLANAGYQYVPVAYNGEVLKQEMQTAVVQSSVLPSTAGNPVEVTKRRIAGLAATMQTPPDTLIDVRAKNSVITAHVQYRKEISILPFGIYKYTYEFDHTATPTGFLTRQ